MSQAIFPANNLTFRQIAKSPVFIAVCTVTSLVVLYFGISPLISWSSDKPEKEPDAVTVSIIKATKAKTVKLDRVYSGLIRSKRSSDLAFERSARLVAVNVDEGDSVDANQPLAILDTQDLEIAKTQVEAEIANALAVLKELKDGPRQEVIESARAERNARHEEYKFTERIKNRRSELNQTGSISVEEWDNAESNYKIAAAKLESSERQLKELVSGTRKEKIVAQRALVKQLKARLEKVDLDIAKSCLRAPFSGKISARFLDEGTIVTPGSPILSITESSNLEAIVGVPARTLRSINRCEPIACNVEGEPCQAKLARILPETDQTTRTVLVVFDLEESRFKPGQIIRISIPEPRQHDGYWIPTEALLPAAKGLWSVFVVVENDGHLEAQRRYVTIHLNDGERSLVGKQDQTFPKKSLIQGTINLGDQIIADGVHKVTNGQRVKVANNER